MPTLKYMYIYIALFSNMLFIYLHIIIIDKIYTPMRRINTDKYIHKIFNTKQTIN